MMKKFIFLSLTISFLCLTGITSLAHAGETASERVVKVPILLYHRISDENSADNRYAVTVADFKEQMERLRYWGYSSITIKQLVDHLNKGSDLPRRPVVISFDDGYLDVYQNAFPIMERYGFTGTVYIVANRLESYGFLQEEQIKELIEHGWDVGSHSLTHTELTQNHALVRKEILQSRLDLENALGIKIFSFAYPFGSLDWYVSYKVYDYGYRAGVGVGNLVTHSSGTIYNLSRREIQGDADLEAFADLMPWSNHFVPAPRRKHIPD
jgi:peptidoglycan/xylan/chitin deacetylase (PgdA/CDA1 family)